MNNLIYAVRTVLNVALSLLQYSVIIECIMTWIPDVTRSSIYMKLSSFNGIFLNPIRKALYKYTSGFPLDISPIILFLIIGLVRNFI